MKEYNINDNFQNVEPYSDILTKIVIFIFFL